MLHPLTTLRPLTLGSPYSLGLKRTTTSVEAPERRFIEPSVGVTLNSMGVPEVKRHLVRGEVAVVVVVVAIRTVVEK